ncbi:rCG40207 [Rattus norvegicus]|uniref:RCG40207 n=1 Tax=Rattus norvegicus TaxID=10116 RepID=A6I895_RAT|nr:rCG40207 [Rattus norvegicus]
MRGRSMTEAAWQCHYGKTEVCHWKQAFRV